MLLVCNYIIMLSGRTFTQKRGEEQVVVNVDKKHILFTHCKECDTKL